MPKVRHVLKVGRFHGRLPRNPMNNAFLWFPRGKQGLPLGAAGLWRTLRDSILIEFAHYRPYASIQGLYDSFLS